MLLKLIGGPRDGDLVHCCCQTPCSCTEFGHGFSNKIMDGYIEILLYRRTTDGWVPDRVVRKTMIADDLCPRCDRPMPKNTIYCLNCGAELHPLDAELES